MRTQIIEKTIYNLNDALQFEKEGDSDLINSILEKHWDINVDFECWDCLLDDFKTIGKILGIDIDNIYFSGFYSQGDGACFIGKYSYAKGWRKVLKNELGGDWLKEITAIGETLQEIQRKRFYGISAGIYRGYNSSLYSHENTVIIDYAENAEGDSLTDKEESDLLECLRDFMRWIYSQLESEYDYLTSRESIINTIEVNGYEFDANGNII